jgi:uncharacterized protein (TIGR03382 family)
MRLDVIVGLCAVGFSATATAAPALPEGHEGIAASYPGDEGIEADASVILADDFEAYEDAAQLSERWDIVFQTQHVRIANEPDNVFEGRAALEFTVPQQNAELSNATDKILSPGQDTVFLRYYSKFQPPYDVVGSSHNGAMISASYFINGQATPGVPADGTNKFLVALENWRGEPETPSPGDLNIYIYHPEQRSQWGDHFFPTGVVLPNSSQPFDFGPDFVPRPDIIPELDRWYCYEYMVHANTPGERDGRIAIWLDGALVADFPNLRLRDVESLEIDRVGLSFHIGSNPNGETKKWYDNVVIATQYIGPLFEPDEGGSSSGGDTSSGDATAGAGDANGTSGPDADDDGPAATTGGTGDTGPAGEADASSGCGCHHDRISGAPALGLTLFSLVLVGRRRRVSV